MKDVMQKIKNDIENSGRSCILRVLREDEIMKLLLSVLSTAITLLVKCAISVVKFFIDVGLESGSNTKDTYAEKPLIETHYFNGEWQGVHREVIQLTSVDELADEER